MKREIKTGFSTAFLMLSLLLYILPVSAQPEEPTWHMYRPRLAPHDTLHIDETVHNANTTDEASVGIGVNVMDYVENWQWTPYDNRDGVCFRVAVTANTRKGITYDCGSPYSYPSNEWIEAVDPVPGVTGDNNGSWLNISLYYGVRFYGGPGYECHSAEYTKVWVCTNGFLTFDSEFTDPPNIGNFPDPAEPNSLIAVHWADLLVDGQAKVTYYSDLFVFCVCWKNVLNKNNGKRQTFEVIIEDDRLFERGQNLVKFLYKNVTWTGSGAIVGIEDQEGYKGTFGYYAPSGQKIEFRSYKKSAEIKRLKIKMEKSDPYALVFTDTSSYSLKGINVMLKNNDPDTGLWYENALNDALSLLMSEAVVLLTGSNAAGIIFEASLIGIDAVASYVKEFSPFKREEADIKDITTPNDPEAHIYVKAEGVHGWPVDAAIGAQVHWVFTDDNTQNHTIRITAELEYTYYNTDGVSYNDKISTSVKLNMEKGYNLAISTGSGGTTNPAPGTYTYSFGKPVTVTASAYSDYEFDFWALDGVPKFGDPITVTMNSDHTLIAYFRGTAGGGEGCPYLHVYNGSVYVCEGLLDIHNPEGIDLIRNHTLVTTPQRVQGAYLFQLVEHPYTHSYIDQVKLYAILKSGITIQLPLIWAWHSEYGNVLPQLLFSDEWKTDTKGANHNNGTSQSINLKFLALPPNTKVLNFIFQIEGNNPELKP